MTPYLIESILESNLCMLVLLGVYRFWLEQEPIHRLKRAFLLGTLLLSLAGPFLSLRLPSGWLSFRSPLQLVEGQISVANEKKESIADEAVTLPQKGNGPASEIPVVTTPATAYWLWLYGIITAMLLLRFARNLYVLICQIRTGPAEPYYGATLVKLPVNGLPYTFLHYLFVSAEAYDRDEIEAELFDHELTHIRQWHSLDVLLVELARCFCWFNPLLFWLKGAIQRNHEFLADQAVNETYLNILGYQQLLLSKVAAASPKLSLTSPLTFQTTKQRLLMMTKQTSPARAWLAGCSTALFFLMLTVLLTGATPDQPPIFPLKSETTYYKPVPLLSVAELESRFGDVLMLSTTQEIASGKIRFRDLTPEQKGRVIYLEGRLPGTFNEEEFDALKNAKRYSVWVDGKRVRHFERTTLHATDIVTYNIKRAYKHVKRPDGYHYQVDLLTDSAANAFAKELQANPRLLLLTKEQMEKRQAKTAK